jgi:hypothetical protein
LTKATPAPKELRVVTLHDDEFFSLTWDPERSLARFVRKARRFADLREAERLYQNLLARRARIQARRILLLVDQRAAIGNNDPAFEALASKVVPALSAGVDRVAVLVRSATGKLQVERMRRNGGTPVEGRVFLDEAEALAYLEH